MTTRLRDVQQSGNVTPTHIATWHADGVVQDGGAFPVPIPTVNLTNGVFFNTRADAAAATIVNTALWVQTQGLSSIGDGNGALYTRTGSLVANGFQSADGAFWKPASTGGTTTFPTINQALIDSLPDGSIISVADGATISAITLTNRNLHFVLAPGTINISGTITLETCSGVTFQGYGAELSGTNGTLLQWTGNNNAIPVFKLSRCQFCSFQGFKVNTSQFNKASAAFWTMSTLTGLNTTQCIWRDINIEGTDATGLQFGFRIGVEGDSNGNNNERHWFENVIVNNYANSGWSIEQPEAKAHMFKNCGFLAAPGVGQNGVTTNQNSGKGGSFWWDGGGGGGNQNADFDLGQVDDVIGICNFNIETSKHLLISEVASAGAWPVLVSNGRWSGNGIAASGNAIFFRNRGPLVVMGCSFENPTSAALALNITTTGPARGVGIAIGNAIDSTLSNPLVSGNTANARWYNYGTVVSNAGGAPTAAIPLPFEVPVLDFSEITTGLNRGMLALIEDSNTTALGTQVASGGGGNRVLAAYNGETNFIVVGATAVGPTTQSGVSYVVDSTGVSDATIICNQPGTMTLTLPAAASFLGRRIRIKTITANTVVSNASNVVPLIGGSAGTAILPATAGKWADLESDGTNWVITAAA